MKKPDTTQQDLKVVSDKEVTRRNFISFASFFGLSALAYGGWRWLYNAPPETPGTTARAKAPLRKVLDQNEQVFRKALSNDHLVKTYPKSMAARHVRVNSFIGLRDPAFAPDTWNLTVNKKDGSKLEVRLDELRALPKTEIVYDFKCVEGWDQISHWGGVRFRDFVAHYNLGDHTDMEYVGLKTPDERYYVGIDMPSAMHPQTLLAYEVNGALLPPQHGQPLRLIIPVKYGIKNLKRIGTMTFSNERPPDYWAEQGYDYFSGL